MARLILTFALGLMLSVSGVAEGRAPSVITIAVTGTRVHAGDLVAGLATETAELDLGPAPTSTGTRFIPREELLSFLRERNVTLGASVPDGFRVRRALRSLSTSDLNGIVSTALAGHLPRGVAFAGLVASPTAVVPDGWSDVVAAVPRPPHRAGRLTSSATLRFMSGLECVWSLTVGVDLALSPDAVPFDVPRGSHVAFVIRRGLVELRATGVVSSDVDVGDVATVTVTPSGKSLPARLEDASTAVMVDVP